MQITLLPYRLGSSPAVHCAPSRERGRRSRFGGSPSRLVSISLGQDLSFFGLENLRFAGHRRVHGTLSAAESRQQLIGLARTNVQIATCGGHG